MAHRVLGVGAKGEARFGRIASGRYSNGDACWTLLIPFAFGCAAITKPNGQRTSGTRTTPYSPILAAGS